MPAGPRRKPPAPRSRIAANTLGESKRGGQSHSTVPSGATRAEVWQSERKAYSAIGGNAETVVMRSSNGVGWSARGRSHGSIAPARRSALAFGVWIGEVSEVSTFSDTANERLHAQRQCAADAGSHSLGALDDGRDGVDQREVRERLREVAEVASAARIELLSVEVERRGVRQQLLAELAGALFLADLRERRNEPERADQERALLAVQAVVGLLGAVAEDQPMVVQLLGHREDRGAYARVVGREETHQRHEQRRCVERLGVVVLDEDPALVDA